MSKCDLGIVLDRPDRRYVPGELVSGKVRVQVNAECNCKALTLVREWRTHGRGNRATGGKKEVVLFVGSWQPGRILDFAFSFHALTRPFTYHGKVLNVDWYLSARADIPWAIDPKAEEEFLLVPGPAPTPSRAGGPAPTVPPAVRAVSGRPGPLQSLGIGCILAFLAPFLLIGIGATVFGVLVLAGVGMVSGDGGFRDAPPVFLILFGLLFAGIPGVMIAMMLRKQIAQRRLGPVAMEVAPGTLRPGDTVTCRVSFRPTALVELEGVEAILVGQEQVVSGSGTKRTTSTHELFRHAAPLAEPRTAYPGKQVECEGTLQIPEDAAPSFEAPDNSLRWLVRVRVKIRRWPDWVQEATISVRP